MANVFKKAVKSTIRKLTIRLIGDKQVDKARRRSDNGGLFFQMNSALREAFRHSVIFTNLDFILQIQASDNKDLKYVSEHLEESPGGDVDFDRLHRGNFPLGGIVKDQGLEKYKPDIIILCTSATFNNNDTNSVSILENGMNDVLANLKKCLAKYREKNIPTIVATPSILHDPCTPARIGSAILDKYIRNDPVMQKYNTAIEQVCKDEGVVYVDVRGKMRAESNRLQNKGKIIKDVSFTNKCSGTLIEGNGEVLSAEGEQVLAGILAQAVYDVAHKNEFKPIPPVEPAADVNTPPEQTGNNSASTTPTSIAHTSDDGNKADRAPATAPPAQTLPSAIPATPSSAQTGTSNDAVTTDMGGGKRSFSRRRRKTIKSIADHKHWTMGRRARRLQRARRVSRTRRRRRVR